MLVGVGKTVRDSCDQPGGFALIDGPAISGMVEGLSFHQLHDDVEHPIGIPEVIDPDQVGVIEAGHRFRLGLKAGAELRISTELAGENLDRDWAIERYLPGGVDRPHSSGRDEGVDLIGRKVRLELLDTGSLKFEISGHCALRE